MGIVEIILLVIYFVVGPLAWGGFGFAMFSGRDRMRKVKRPIPPTPDPAPSATILVPAKDEGQRIRDCLTSALAQDYPNFKVIAVDDRSTDATGTIMDEMAASDPRLQIVHIRDGQLPKGWTGKNNAIYTGVKHADGEWLLFFDSDVILEADALRATLTSAVTRKYDMISLLPRLESHSFWEGLLIPLAGASVMTMYLAALSNDDNHPNLAFGNGQFMLMSRKVYDAFGGHEAVRDKYCEDMYIARAIKAKGFRARFVWGNDFCAVRMYSSLKEIMRGWSRIFFSTSAGRPWRILGAVAFILVCCFSAYAALGWGVTQAVHGATLSSTLWLTFTVLHATLMLVFLSIMYVLSGNHWSYALAFPLAQIMLLRIYALALKTCLTGKLEWRGTVYTKPTADPVAIQTNLNPEP